MAGTPKRKKSSILINPRFQWTLIGYAAVLTLVILVSMFGLFSLGFHEFLVIGQQAGLPSDHVYFQFIQMQEATFVRVFAALALVVGSILIVGGLVVSHKIAGPIYRMKKEFTEMVNQDPVQLKKINFRKGDFFPELADSYNEVVDKMKG